MYSAVCGARRAEGGGHSRGRVALSEEGVQKVTRVCGVQALSGNIKHMRHQVFYSGCNVSTVCSWCQRLRWTRWVCSHRFCGNTWFHPRHQARGPQGQQLHTTPERRTSSEPGVKNSRPWLVSQRKGYGTQFFPFSVVTSHFKSNAQCALKPSLYKLIVLRTGYPSNLSYLVCSHNSKFKGTHADRRLWNRQTVASCCEEQSWYDISQRCTPTNPAESRVY